MVPLALDDDRDAGSFGHHGLAGEVHPEVVAGFRLEVGLQVDFVKRHRVPQL